MGAERNFTNMIVHAIREFTALLCIVILIPGNAVAVQTQQSPASTQQTSVKLPPDQLDSLVAPIALYPDPLLSQTLVASTYPLEVIQLKQWLDQNKNLKDTALVDAVKKQDWDPSIRAMAPLPDVVKQLADNIKWTADLGNAFLAQQNDVMDAVQRMRKKANDAGNLKSTEQQKVETQVIENKQVIVIEQANPQVVYVPSYNPVVVYGPPVYPYPPLYYPPVGYYAAGMAISFGIGIAMGAAWGGGWGYGCGWGGNNNVYINHNNNNFNGGNRNNIGNGNRGNGNRPSTLPSQGGGRSNWQHNPQHRGGAPYSDRATADRFGGNTRGDSVANRQANARRNTSPRAGQQPAGGRDLSNRGGGPSAGTRDVNRGGGGADRVGNRQVSPNRSTTNRSAFGGASGGYSGSQARASSSRGSSSMGGGSRGGGGGGRSGGGRRR